jgi:hypothetical protein
MTFHIHVVVPQGDGLRELRCSDRSNCKIVYRRKHSPAIYYISPRVIYANAETELWFDPRATPDLIKGLQEGDMPFVNARIGGALMEFTTSVGANDEYVSFETSFSNWNKNRVRGSVGDLPISDKHAVSMLWETGQASMIDHAALWCNYDGESCYYAKSVPVITSLDKTEGWYTGG